VSTIGIIGGTGLQGRGLGYRFARAGHNVILGSRAEVRASQAAIEVAKSAGRGLLRGTHNRTAAEAADLVLLAIPFEGHDELVSELAPQLTGKVVISCVNPLGFDIHCDGSCSGRHWERMRFEPRRVYAPKTWAQRG
jgi:NADPH-dependent F420 reductase